MFKTWKERHSSEITEIGLALKLIWHSPLALLGLILVIGLVLVAIFGPWIATSREEGLGLVVHMDRVLQPPSWNHLFGTDDLGRDLFSRVVYGTQISLMTGLIVVAIGMSSGVLLGLVSGYMGGITDQIIMRITDAFLSLPGLIINILIAFALGRSLTNAILAMSVTWWTGYVRLVRSMVLSLREQPFIEAAKMVGASRTRIILVHILPNCLSPIMVRASLDLGMGVGLGAMLGFLGLGASPPTPEWGLLISTGRQYMPQYWWYSMFPGLAIAVAVLGFNLLGDGLRDILDPQLRRQISRG